MIEQEDEMLTLQIERSNAREKMKEVYAELEQLRKLTKQYEKFYLGWQKKYNKADMALAELDGRLYKVTITPTTPKLPTSIALHLTKDQVVEIAAKLGAEIKFEDEREEQESD